MNDDPQKDKDVLKTFDMYHFFSRKDVILAIALILFLLGYAIYKTVFVTEAV